MIPPPRSNRHPPREDDDEVASSGFLRYVIGRPLMLIAWGVALWGTFVALRLVWIAATRGAMEASVLFGDPMVLVPVLVAVLAWMVLGFALRGRGEPPRILDDDFRALSPAQRRAVHEQLVGQALERWKAYAEREGEIRYRESVVGTEQVVDPTLPADAFSAACTRQGCAEVARRYGEPRAALQDRDLEFPEAIGYAYNAV